MVKRPMQSGSAMHANCQCQSSCHKLGEQALSVKGQGLHTTTEELRVAHNDVGSWRTSIARVSDGVIEYRGRGIAELIESAEVPDVWWSLVFGGSPDQGQRDALRRVLIAAADHGVFAPSTVTSRIAASVGVSAPLAVAAGLIAYSGVSHGGAAEAAALMFTSIRDERSGASSPEARRIEAYVLAKLAGHERLPGYGHPYHAVDPRVRPLMEGIAPSRVFRDLAMAVERELQTQTGKALRMNADAAIAALLLDAGLEPADVTLVTTVARVVGLASHSREERREEPPFRGPTLGEVEYVEPSDAAPRAAE
jgi:citrate synthase